MTQSFQQLLVTNYGLQPSGYTGSQGVQGIAGTGGGPKISAVQVTNSSGTVLDDTAVDTAGGYILLTGTGFEPGCQVLINTTPAVSTTFVSATQVRAQVPATAAGTYIVYLVNADGGVAIRINGITFSAVPAWVTSSALSGDSDTVISIQLSADGALTYSLAAGSTLPPGLTLSAGGLLSGTVTGIELETVYNFTVNAIDAELQDSPRSFAITISTGDPQIAYVTTLLSPTLEVLPFNRDASTNNLTVSVTGDVRPSNLSPFTLNYSNFFNGSSEYLTVPNTAQFLPESGNFTFEAWTYVTTTVNAQATLAGVWKLSGGLSWQLIVNGSIVTLRYNGDQSFSTASGTAPAGQWNHIAWVKNGSTNTIYINGVARATATAATINSSAEPLAIGFNLDNAPSSWYFPGYVSNLRIVKGTAVYTAGFVPSTDPLPVIAGTSLLTCVSGSAFVDRSANTFPVTRVGFVTISSFYPVQQSIGASAYFDGTGDSMGVAATAPVLLNGDYTVEAWIWLDANNIEYPVVFASLMFYVRFGNSGFGWKLQTATADSGVSTVYSSPVTQTDAFKRWSHVALTRQSGVNRLFFNGVQQNLNTGANPGTYPLASWTDSVTVGGSTWSIGAAWNGYISNFRVVKGTAVYTASFTPPAAPLTAIANTSLLTCQTNQPANNNAFIDSSSSNLPITRLGNATQGSLSPYGGGWSNYFDGTGDFLSVPSNAAFNFGSENFTIETWINIQARPGSGVYPGIVSSRTGFTSQHAWSLYLNENTGAISFTASSSGGSPDLAITLLSNPVLGTWYHVAVSRVGNIVYTSVNGVVTSTAYSNSIHSSSSILNIGRLESGLTTNAFTGYISNLRIIKGTGLYTAAFTPPVAPLQPIAGTSLLTCCDNQLIDDSANNFTVTRSGDVRVEKFNPFGIQTAMTPASHSVFFDGTGDFLSAPSNTAFAYGTGNFTIESWIYVPSVATASQGIVDNRATSSSATGFYFGLASATIQIFSQGVINLTGGTIVPLTWTHVAVTREGSTIRLFVNGVQVNTATNSTNWTDNALLIGAAAVGGVTPITGCISNLRIVKGTAVYTADFTPATTPLTAIANTSLLTCQSPTFVDNSTNRFSITAAGDVRPSQINPFGFTAGTKTSYTPAVYGGSMTFDGSGDRVVVPSSSTFSFGTGDFTIEGWFYLTSNTGGYRAVTIIPHSAGAIALRFGNSADYLSYFQVGVISQTAAQVYSTNQSQAALLNSWVHVAFTRSSSTCRLFLNGIQRNLGTGTNVTSFPSASFSDSTNIINNGSIGVGDATDGTNSFIGHISGLRITNGTALYTSSFVPPTAPLEPVTNTTLLVNGTAAAVRDASMGNNLETVGDAKSSTSVVKYGSTSMSFDGTGDYLRGQVGQNTLATANFTIEMWVYPQSAVGYQCILQIGSTNPYIFIGINTGSTATPFMWNDANVIVGSQNFALNTWQHWAIVRNNGTVTMYLNGTSIGTASFPGNLVDTVGAYLGTNNGGTQGFAGNISDLRITKGVARYTATFTPPAGAFKTK